MSQEYTDPLIKRWGGVIVFAVGILLVWVAAYCVLISQIDSRVEYCPDTRTYIPVRDCKEVR